MRAAAGAARTCRGRPHSSPGRPARNYSTREGRSPLQEIPQEMASTSLRDLPTDEYFPATNAFLRSLAEPEPQRPPTASVRSRSAAASENWRVADATERAATERAERAYRALEKS